MMKNRLFIDTWGWVVIHNKREPRHTEVNRFYHNFRLEKGEVYTTDYVLDETITLLFRRLPFDLAKASLTLLNESFEKGISELGMDFSGKVRGSQTASFKIRRQTNDFVY